MAAKMKHPKVSERMLRKYLITLLFVVICLSLNSTLSANKKLFNKAWECMDYMNYSQAVSLLEQAITEDPEKKDLRSLLAFAYYRLHKYENAIKVLKQELKLFPESLKALILLGYVQFQQDKIADTVAVYRDYEILLEKAQKGKIWKNLRKLKQNMMRATSRKEYNSAIAKFRHEHPNIALPHFVLGVFHKKQNNFSESIKNIRLALEMGYDPVACHIQLIDLEYIKEDWETGLARSQEALNQEGPQAEIYFLMGYGYYHMGDIEKSVVNFKKAIELKPFQSETLKNLAKIYYNQDEFELGIPLLNRVHALIPYDFEANSLLKQMLDANPLLIQSINPTLTKNSIEEIRLEYTYIFIMDINKVLYSINNTFINMVRTGQLSSARNLILNFLQICDVSSKLNYNLAKLYELKGNLGKALKYAWRAMELKSDYDDVNLARSSYGRHFATDLGGGSMIARLPQRSQKQKKNNKDVYDLIGSIFFKLEDFPNSLRFYEKVIEFDPDDAMSHYNLGCVHLALEDYPRAEEHWKLTIQKEKRKKQAKNKEKTSSDKLEISLTVENRLFTFEAHKSLGHLYLQKNLKEKALEEFIKAIDLESEDADLHLEVGKIYIELNNPEKANYYFKKYLYLGGKEENVKKILRSMQESDFG